MQDNTKTLLLLVTFVSVIIIGITLYDKFFKKRQSVSQEELSYKQLIDAIQNNEHEIVSDMCYDLPLNILRLKDEHGSTILHYVMKYGRMDAARVLIERLKYEDFVVVDHLKVTPLMSSIYSHDIHICDLLIKKLEMKDLNAQNNQGKTALMIVCDEYEKESAHSQELAKIGILLVETMSKNGLLMKDSKGLTALEYAYNYHMKHVVYAIEQKIY
jgi:hypothetical protein